MAVSPKDGNETGVDDPDANKTGVPESGVPESGVPESGGQETGDSVTGSEAIDSVAAGTDDGATASADGTSGQSASDHLEGGEGRDTLSEPSSDAAPASPWSTTTASAEADTSTGRSGSSGGDGGSSEASKTKSGGAGRLVVFLILVVLVAGAGYATYPQWRDQAEPYARMVGLSLPEVPAATDAQSPATAQGESAPDGGKTASAQSETAQTETTQAAPVPTAPVQAGPVQAAPAQAQETEPPVSGVSVEAFEALVERVAAAEAEIGRIASGPAASGSAPDAAATVLADRVAALESKLTALNDEMAIVRQGLGNADDTDGVSEAAAALSDRLSDLDARLSAVENAPAVTRQDLTSVSDRLDAVAQADRDGTADLGARIEALAAAQQDLADRLSQGRNVQEKAGAFLLATNLLAATSTHSGGFSAELDAVEAAALDQPEVDDALATLRAHAAGVASVADLRVRLPGVAASAIDASIVGADDGVVGTALTRIAALVTLRRTETDDGDAIDAIVNRAEAAANAGDLPAAVEALSALDGDPATVAAPWIAEAKARIAVNAAVRVLQSRALATLSGG
ncbi:MAG: mitofilin family membrane protein [Alphaproteobacteria bacterium]|nr:mitofilin family membrane protein [Alphaproteobacteria bacterium]